MRSDQAPEDWQDVWLVGGAGLDVMSELGPAALVGKTTDKYYRFGWFRESSRGGGRGKERKKKHSSVNGFLSSSGKIPFSYHLMPSGQTIKTHPLSSSRSPPQDHAFYANPAGHDLRQLHASESTRIHKHSELSKITSYQKWYFISLWCIYTPSWNPQYSRLTHPNIPPPKCINPLKLD